MPPDAKSAKSGESTAQDDENLPEVKKPKQVWPFITVDATEKQHVVITQYNKEKILSTAHYKYESYHWQDNIMSKLA